MVSDVFVNWGADNTEVDTCGLEDEIKPSDIYTRTRHNGTSMNNAPPHAFGNCRLALHHCRQRPC